MGSYYYTLGLERQKLPLLSLGSGISKPLLYKGLDENQTLCYKFINFEQNRRHPPSPIIEVSGRKRQGNTWV